jgi:cell division protein FtsI (penicillin-binding protein 3)
VADKVYSTSLEIHKEINSVQPKYAVKAPSVKQGSKTEVENVLNALKIKAIIPESKSDWVSVQTRDSVSVTVYEKNTEDLLKRGIVPNLIGMTAQDVLYLLENNGMRVKIIGNGAVSSQSIEAGKQFTKGTQIILQLI